MNQRLTSSTGIASEETQPLYDADLWILLLQLTTLLLEFIIRRWGG